MVLQSQCIRFECLLSLSSSSHYVHNPYLAAQQVVKLTPDGGVIFRMSMEPLKAKEKYRGVFEIQKSGDKTSSGEIGLDIRKTCKSQSGTGPGVRRSKRPLLACRTRCICSMETLYN